MSDDHHITTRLRAAGCVFAEDETAVLLATTADPVELESMVQRRVAGLPLEQVVGWAGFCGLRIIIEPGVFVPRRRTEFLAWEAIRLAAGARVAVDLCCGSGAIGAALAAVRPGLELYAVDVDPTAVHCARRNLPHATVAAGDLYDPLPASLRGRVDVLVANAPYVPTGAIGMMPPEARDHEPAVALDGGADGLDVLRRVIAGARDWLAPGGRLLFESSVAQMPSALAAVRAAGLRADTTSDDEINATVIIGALEPPD